MNTNDTHRLRRKSTAHYINLAFDDCINMGLKRFMWGRIHLESILHLVLQRKNQPRLENWQTGWEFMNSSTCLGQVGNFFWPEQVEELKNPPRNEWFRQQVGFFWLKNWVFQPEICRNPTRKKRPNNKSPVFFILLIDTSSTSCMQSKCRQQSSSSCCWQHSCGGVVHVRSDVPLYR